MTIAVVTGAGSGIGRAVALGLAETGARVVAADLDLAAAEVTLVPGNGAPHATVPLLLPVLVAQPQSPPSTRGPLSRSFPYRRVDVPRQPPLV